MIISLLYVSIQSAMITIIMIIITITIEIGIVRSLFT